jgi:GntR family transcriptional regulator
VFLHIERGSSVPLSAQIMEQLRSQCLTGKLRPGDRLPSVRDLATQLAVNVNTVFRVYERLAAEGLVELRHGDGTYVSPQGGEVQSQLLAQRQKFDLEFEAVVNQGLMLGLSATELRAKVSAIVGSKKTSLPGSGKSST